MTAIMTDATEWVTLRAADPQLLAKAANVINTGVESPMRDTGF